VRTGQTCANLFGEPGIDEQIVTRVDELAGCCDHIARFPRFGLDTEFVGEDTYHPHLCLVQVATPERLILIDPLSAGPLDNFWKLVTDQAKQVIVHAGREEIRLCRLWTGRNPGNLFDLQIAAGLVGLTYPLGHAALVSQLLGVHMAKGQTLTEWRHRPLTREQVHYAFDDVRYLLPLWQKLNGRLQALDRLEWAQEEFSRLPAHVVPEDTVVERWRKLRGLGSLDRRRLAVARELFNWREEMAVRSNRPARSICRDDLIVEIARRCPGRERDLKVIRGLPRRDLDGILEAVQRALALPPEEQPAPAERDQDPPQAIWAANLLGAVLGDLCARRQLAIGLTASGAEIKLLVRSRFQGNPVPADLQLAQGWRSRHILPELLDVLDGNRSVRIRDIRADAPLALE
jgi:ribonuclease D